MRDSEIKQLIHEGNERAYNGRLTRLKFLLSTENQEPFPTPTLVSEYYEEARLCWYVGAFVATILMVQLSFEELFRSHYRVTKGVGGNLHSGKKVDSAGFFDLIEEAKMDMWISEEEANLLHNLRKNIRNLYVHTKDTKFGNDGKPDYSKPDFFTQTLKIVAPEIIGANVVDDAKDAIHLMITLLPEISRRGFP